MSLIRPALLMLLLFTVITGVVYPGVVTGIAQVVFSDRADGSPIRQGDRVVGSELVGQPFDDGRYFWTRPSAIGYDAKTSSGTNLGPTHPALIEAVQKRIANLRAADPGNDGPVPVDLVTASSSGLDPHVSPAAAHYQVRRVAKARGLDEAKVRGLVDTHTEGRTLGILGDPRVNVLRLNLALDALH